MEKVTFDTLPTAVEELSKEMAKKMQEIKSLILDKNEVPSQKEDEIPINLTEVVKITGLTKHTLYGYVSRKQIPCYKRGKRLYFLKSEIIKWLIEDRNKTMKEIEEEADTYLSNTKKGLK